MYNSRQDRFLNCDHDQESRTHRAEQHRKNHQRGQELPHNIEFRRGCNQAETRSGGQNFVEPICAVNGLFSLAFVFAAELLRPL
jgi:hypothetical protein